MTLFFKTATAALLLSVALIYAPRHKKMPLGGSTPALHSLSANAQQPPAAPKIQAAILLDVSGSMNGLIEQGKAQLWNMVSVMGRAKCDGSTPQIEIALYEYGSPRNPAAGGYVKQLSAFTTDLDGLSKTLFGLRTDGGDEYCGQVIYTSVNELSWDTSAASYKVIFIAGNEDFLQGSLHYTKACEEARKKGILVNTIYCGDKAQGILEHWNLAGECGGGSFTNINHNAAIEDIPTPYDSSLLVLNEKLNGTYIGYGSRAFLGATAQVSADKLNYSANKSVAMKRIAVKGKKELYNNASWDLVDALDKDGDGVLDKFDAKTLPDSLQRKSKAELKQLVKAKAEERSAVQTQIGNLSVQRENYLAEERKRRAATNNQPTLESETEKLIKTQAKRFNMLID